MQLITANQQTMTSREIAELVESRHDSVKRSIERLAETGAIQLPPLVDVKNEQGQSVSEYHIGKRDTYVIVAQLSPQFTARLVDRWQELEAQQPAPRELTRMELLQIAMDAEKEKLEALALADHAIATKAEIGHRREATAMNTASQAVKKANALEIELDKSKQYSSIKRMEMLHHGVKFDWRKLKSTGMEMGIDTIDIFDANYGTVKAYHAEVWKETYALGIE